jgi:hypothetical protein
MASRGPVAELPSFLNICASTRGFNVRKRNARLLQKAFAGMVVASADAFYFVAGPGVQGEEGLFGTSDPLVQELDLEELTAEVTGDHGWPVTWKQGPVLVVPRQAVQSLRTSLMLGGIELVLTDVRILVFTPVFRRQQMAGYLQAKSWDVSGAKPASRLPARDRERPAAEVERGKQARAQLVIGILFLLIGVALPIWQWRWIQSALAGPVPMSVAEVGRLEDPASLDNPWISLRFDQVLDTGIEKVDAGRLNTLLGRNRLKYLLIRLPDAWLIAAVPIDYTGNQIVGYLDQWQTPFSRDSLERIHTDFPGLHFKPFQLDAYYSYRREELSLLALAGISAVIGIFCIVLSTRFRRKKDMSQPSLGPSS